MKLLLLALLIPLSLLANVGADAQAKKGRTCRIVFPERPKSAPRTVYLFDGKKNQQVFLPRLNFSEVINLPAGELTIMMAPKEVDQENLPQDVPTLKIPEGLQDFYILLVADLKNAKLPLRMILLNTDGGKLLPGSTLWCNLTNHRISANLGEMKMEVEPNGSTVSASPIPKSGYYRADLFYQHEAEGKARVITEQKWWYDANSRHLGIIVPSAGRLPKIFYYRDFR